MRNREVKKIWDAYSSVNTLQKIKIDDFPFFSRCRPDKAARLLDIGCGTGAHMEMFTACSNNVFGIDLSPSMLGDASKKGFQVCQANLLHLPFREDSFNFVYSIMAINYVKNWKDSLAEIARVLEPGGMGVISGANTWSFIGPLRKIFHAIGLYQFGAVYHTSISSMKKAGIKHSLTVQDHTIINRVTPLGRSPKRILYSICTRFDRLLNFFIPWWGAEAVILFVKE